MMASGLSQCAHFVRKSECIHEIIKGEDALQALDTVNLDNVPFRYLWLKFSHFRLRNSWFTLTTRSTFHLCQLSHYFRLLLIQPSFPASFPELLAPSESAPHHEGA